MCFLSSKYAIAVVKIWTTKFFSVLFFGKFKPRADELPKLGTKRMVVVPPGSHFSLLRGCR